MTKKTRLIVTCILAATGIMGLWAYTRNKKAKAVKKQISDETNAKPAAPVSSGNSWANTVTPPYF